MQWSLRLRAAERGIWKSAELRRMLADAGLEISAGKMSSWWAGTPPTMRLVVSPRFGQPRSTPPL